MNSDRHSRTESATPRRREEARRRGDVAVSRDLTTGLGLLAAVAALYVGGRFAGVCLGEAVRGQLRSLPFAQLDADQLQLLAWMLAGRLVVIAGGVVLAAGMAHLLVSGLQAGGQISLTPLAPDWERINPTQGWQRLLSWSSLMRGVLGLVKTVALSLIFFLALRKQAAQIAFAGDAAISDLLAYGWKMSLDAAFSVSAALVIIGAFDYLYQRWQHEIKLRMTRQEVMDERKQDEGDPLMRARVKRVQRDMAQRRMLRDARSATVLLTNPTHYAVALKYEQTAMAAPRVVAKGVDEMAKRLREIAAEHEIPILERPALARSLFRTVEVGEEIPPALYQAIAEIVAYLYRWGQFR